jgi:tetratricopeptide (TPR) repeat protein
VKIKPSFSFFPYLFSSHFQLFFIALFILPFSLSAQNDSLKQLVKSATSDTSRFRICNELSVQLSASDNAASIYFARQAKSIAEKINDKRGTSESLNNLAFALFNSGKSDSAIILYHKSILLSRQAGDSANVIDALNHLGYIYREKGDNTSALKFYNQALSSNVDEKNISQAANSYLNIGVIYQDQKNLPEALRYEQTGLKLYLETGLDAKIANCYARIGNVYNEMKDSAKAEEYYKKAMPLFEKGKSKRGVAVCLNNLASFYEDRHQMDTAEDYYLRALNIREQIGDKNGAALICNNLGEFYNKIKKPERALIYFTKGLNLAQEIGYQDGMLTNYLGLSITYERLGDDKKALENYRNFHNIYDTLFNQENSKQINELNSQFDVERKQKKIELLTKGAVLKDAIIEKKNTQAWFLYAGLIGIVIIAFVILRSAVKSKRANVILENQKNKIAEQKKIVEEQHHDILDSINYAQRIQTAVLPSNAEMKSLFPKSFVFFQPRDIVSGDFWWMGQCGKIKIIAVADCTGHGVPGAFMSLIGNTALNEIVKEKHISDPGEILAQLTLAIVGVLKQEQQSDSTTDSNYFLKGVKDGMDIAICCLDEENGILKFSGANNPIYYVSEGMISEIKGDRQPIGLFEGNLKPFSVHTINLKKLEMFYLFSDGYADQFGGENGKKFKYSCLKDLLFSIHKKSTAEQEQELSSTFKSWKGKLEQVDDVCVVGIMM